MRLVILGSSSAGNCYLLDNGSECLMVECGMPFTAVLQAVAFDLRRIVGCLISHEHKDHCREVRRCLQARIPVYCSEGTAQALHLSGEHLVHTFHMFDITKVGNFSVLPFATQHDAAAPCGFLLSHAETGGVLFATDTYYLRYRFRGMNNIMLECNYDSALLEERYRGGLLSRAQYLRTLRSHMSYATCLQTLSENDLSAVNNIVLLHLSEGNSDAGAFARGVASATGKSVIIADKGVVVPHFGATPY